MRAICAELICVCFLAFPALAQNITASLTGKVTDVTGAGIPGTQAELLSQTKSDRRFRTSADSVGMYHFTGLPTDEYILRLELPGFNPLTVKSVHVLESEEKSLPALQLELGSIGGGSEHASLEYVRILPSSDGIGDLGGSIRIDRGSMFPKTPPITGVDVTLMCSTGQICGATRTNADGEFMFKTLPPGKFSVRVNRTGFYQMNMPGYMVREGLESVYWSIYMEPCARGNCDPRRRPTKRLPRCA